MECSICGPTKDHDLLFNCPKCKLPLCDEHLPEEAHHCKESISTNLNTQRNSGYYTGQNWTIDLSNIMQQARQQITREPTKQEAEYFLRSNPSVLTTGRESLDLTIGILLIAFVFGFRPLLDGSESWQFIVMLTIIITPAFILHEMGHKFAAIKYGKYARFTLIKTLAYLTFIVGLIGFGIAAPGATYIIGNSNKRENGIFAAAGPAINFALASISYLFYLIASDIIIPSLGLSLKDVFLFSAFINAFLGVFNLIPISIFDGKKIYNWNFIVWAILLLLNLGFVLLSYNNPLTG